MSGQPVMLSKNFSVLEFYQSATARQAGIDNTMPASAIAAARELCERVLEPLRSQLNAPIFINSGYRCSALNLAIGGTAHSQHLTGEAADISSPKVSPLVIARTLLSWPKPAPYDQLILENYKAGKSWSGWVHISRAFKAGAQAVQRGQVLSKLPNRNGYTTGLAYMHNNRAVRV